MNKWIPLVALFCVQCLLSACTPFGENGAKSAESAELMGQAFPGWRSDKTEFPFSAFQYKAESETMSYSTLSVSPQGVAKLSDTNVVLLTKAGTGQGGYSTGALLGAYWFTLREGRWHLVKRQHSVAELGQYGDFDRVHLNRLGDGVVAVFVEHGWSGSGMENQWVAAFRVDSEHIGSLFANEGGFTLYQSNNNVEGYDCETLLEKPAGYQVNVTIEDASSFSHPDRCMHLQATWKFRERKGVEYPDLIVSETKLKIAAELLASRETNEGYSQEDDFRLKVTQKSA